jgi:hypothetical protein
VDLIRKCKLVDARNDDLKETRFTIVANVTVINTSEMLLRFTSSAVAKAVGITADTTIVT